LKEKVPSKNEDRCSDQTQASLEEIKTTRKLNPRKKSRFNLQLKRNILTMMMMRKRVLELNNKSNMSYPKGWSGGILGAVLLLIIVRNFWTRNRTKRKLIALENRLKIDGSLEQFARVNLESK
jgi:hypothetical protein